jgi:lysophospholipase L1-like esterase
VPSGFKLLVSASSALVARWAALLSLLLIAACALVPIIWSQPLRNTYLLTLHRYVAKLTPPRFVFAGDSLTANANWGWAMTRNPFSAANLAEEGARVAEVAGQVSKAKAYHANILFVTAGTNDIVIDNRAVEQLACDFELLLRRVPSEMRLIMTFIPYTSFREHTVKIQEVNLMLERFSKNGHFNIVDINPELSANGVLKSKYTFDGIHFNDRAYEIWTDKLMRVAVYQHGQ